MSRVPLRGILPLACFLVIACLGGAVRAADDNPLEGLKVGGEAFVDWSSYDTQGVKSNAFTLQRGYVVLTKKANSWLSFRYTLDVKPASTDVTVTEDVDGSVAVTASNALDGNYVFRTKHLFAEMALGSAGFLSDVRARIGMQHVGPDDFEQSMNPFRMQDKFWLERSGLFGTADLGVGLQGSFGGKLEDAKGKTGSAKYDGRHGSFQLALTNGSGYDKAEKNQNKVFTGRLSFRPLAAVPGLQATWAGAFGKDNTTDGADALGNDFSFNLGMLSWQSPLITVYGQLMAFTGNQAGKYVYGSGAARESLSGQAWSIFGTVRLPDAKSPFWAFARYNSVDPDTDHHIVTADQADATQVMTGGVAYELAKGSTFLVSYDVTSYDAHSAGLGKAPSASAKDLADDKRFQVVYRLEF